MKDRTTKALLVSLFGCAWVTSLVFPLLSPQTALANRDIPLFHLPLRISLQRLAELGFPSWNPWLHGGQPVLSNPNYAAFYPPTWLCLAVSPSYSLNLIVVLHLAFAFAGAYRLAKRLGCEGSGSLLAALSFSGGGATLSLLNVFTDVTGFAWIPWILDLAVRLIDQTRGPEPVWTQRPAWFSTAFYLALAAGAQFLCGEPMICLTTFLALLALVAGPVCRRPVVLLPFAAAGVLTLLLGAVQLLPLLGRLAGTPRASGVNALEALTWSMPPSRVIEMVLPRFFGDPSRVEDGLFFGWDLNDRNFPFVASLYSGSLVALLALAALLRWRIPHRWSWIAMFATSLFLAFGRQNPLYVAMRRTLPVLSAVRFPEKFVLLGVVALILAGSLGWSRLLAERAAGRRKGADFAFALALLLLAVTLTLALAVSLQPDLAAWFAKSHGSPAMTPADLVRAQSFLIAQSWLTVALAALLVALMALLRFSRVTHRTLQFLALGLAAIELWSYQHGLVKTIPAEAYRTPPRAAQPLLPPRDRIFVQSANPGEVDPFRRDDAAGTGVTRAMLARLEPYSGLLWGLPYGFHQDYDLMLTHWASRALAAATRRDTSTERRLRFLGAWNVGTLIVRKPAEILAKELEHDPQAVPVLQVANPYRLERFRFVPIVAFHQTYGKALLVAQAQGFALDRREHCVRPGQPAAVVGFPVPPRLLALRDLGSRVQARYSAGKGACFVMATTYDRGWKAEVDGDPVEVFPTAASQMAMLLPAGDGRQLTVSYADPWVRIGAMVSAMALCAGIAVTVLLRLNRRSRRSAATAS